MLGIFGAGNRASNKELVCEAGCFGKLPCQPDFVRHNAGQREIMALDQWVQQAVAMLSRRVAGGSEDVWRRVPSVNFAILGGDDERSMFGTMVPSRDRSGRIYPFVTFGLSVFPLLREIQSGVPAMLENFFCKAKEINSFAANAESLDTVKVNVDALCFDNPCPSKGQVLDKMLNYLHSVPMADFRDVVLRGATPDIWDVFVTAFIGALKEAKRRQPSRIGWGFYLPLGTSSQHLAGLIFAARVIDVALSGMSWRAHYFWFQNEETGLYEAAIFMRQPPSSLLLALASPTAGDGVLQDLWKYAESNTGRVTPASDSGFSSAASLPDLINRIAAAVGK